MMTSGKMFSLVMCTATCNVMLQDVLGNRTRGLTGLDVFRSSSNICIVNAAHQFSIRKGKLHFTARQLSAFNERSLYFYLNST